MFVEEFAFEGEQWVSAEAPARYAATVDDANRACPCASFKPRRFAAIIVSSNEPPGSILEKNCGG
ncbi:MAG: hypothetical protein ABI671_03665 [Burkholderiales bacterium]